MKAMLQSSIAGLRKLLVQNRRLLLVLVVLILAGLALGVLVLWPAYKSPASRMYDSSLGYAALTRKLGRAFPVVLAEAREREFVRPLLAEGVCSAEPYLVPVVPMARITGVMVEEGQRVEAGAVLLELDRTKAEIKLESARLALATSRAELERVRVGSAYVLAQERPDREKINVEAARQRAEQATEKVERFRAAERKGLISRTQLLEVEQEFTGAVQEKELAELFLKMSEQGVKQSEAIAENAVKDAEEAVKHREAELADYVVRAPVGGIVERVLMRAGEYNQDAGKPGFVIAAGLWFEGYFDQADFAWVKQGMTGTAQMESYPGQPVGIEVERVVPVVSFNDGGPETSRPLRPRGTGAPEWAATFAVRLGLRDLPEGVDLAPGMTGFARIESRRRSLAVPREALVSVSAGRAMVHVVAADGTRALREVGVGMVDGVAAEILHGLEPGEKVIAEGHWGLKDEDRIRISGEDGWN